MDWLQALYPDVGAALLDAAPMWHELRGIIERELESPFSSAAILALATCRAVGGHPGNAVPAAAAILACEMALRMLDDLADGDRADQLWQEIGAARTYQYAAALQAMAFNLVARASYPPWLSVQLHKVFAEALVFVAMGQDRDLQGKTSTVDDYWLTIELKTATAYAAACMAGAVVGTTDDALIRTCSKFGHHVGLALQVFNDLESIWMATGATDLQMGKVTLPLIYALQQNHPYHDELAYIVEQNLVSAEAERVREIFDHVDAKSFMLWAAIKEREQALEALTPCPDDEGKAALTAFVTSIFGDIDSIANG